MLHRRDTDSVDAAERPSDEHYRRFLTLVRQRHRGRLGPGASWPATGALPRARPGLLARSSRAPALDLAWLADALGEARIADESRAAARAGRRGAAGARRRRRPDPRRRRDRRLAAAGHERRLGAGAARARAARASRWPPAARRCVTARSPRRYGVRSLDAGHPERSARNYWRGPVWANVTWLSRARARAATASARPRRRCASGCSRPIEGGGMREYFVPDSGRGLGARDFAWTAALVPARAGRAHLDCCRDGSRARVP